jgi:transcriptional regulator
MHPSRSFRWENEEEILAFIADVAFCTIYVAGPYVLHVPVTVAGPGRLRFHVSRANRAAPALDGARALLSCLGPDAYVSPDWYGTADQVPTWNYVAVEAEGPLRRLSEAELVAQLHALAADHEARLAPKPVWTRDKMDPARFEALVRAVAGYELATESLRGTRKLGQTKNETERSGSAAGLDSAGRADMAALMRAEYGKI